MEYRQAMVDNCRWAIKNRSEIHYGQVRPNRYLLSDEFDFFGAGCPVTYLRLRSNDAV
jgi:hypothetical protein